eukprot:987579-Karenia_brevis.AAC.1
MPWAWITVYQESQTGCSYPSPMCSLTEPSTAQQPIAQTTRNQYCFRDDICEHMAPAALEWPVVARTRFCLSSTDFDHETVTRADCLGGMWPSSSRHAARPYDDSSTVTPESQACSSTHCNGTAYGLCEFCAKPYCSRHAYTDDHGVLLACLECGGPPPPMWQCLRAEHNAAKRARLADDSRTDGDIPDHHLSFQDGCLVHSLNRLGVPLVQERNGPFWALGDGNAMLAPHQLALTPMPMQAIYSPGRYIFYTDNHFKAMVTHKLGITVMNGTKTTEHTQDSLSSVITCGDSK